MAEATALVVPWLADRLERRVLVFVDIQVPGQDVRQRRVLSYQRGIARRGRRAPGQGPWSLI